MDPSFSQLSRVVHQERLEAAEKYRRFNDASAPGEEISLITKRSLKWVALLVMVAILALNG
jgi:hypothetical protein